jgi:hypothetical protein
MNEDFLSRWSRLKRSGSEAKAAPAAPPVSQVPAAPQPGAAAAPPAPPPLPPIESLEPGADIAQFMKAEVEEGLKRQAVKKLLQDPRFNVMDGLDVYIDDFSKPDPLPEGWLEKMTQTARLGEYREPEPVAGEAEEKEEQAAPPPGEAGAPESAPPADTSGSGSSDVKREESRPDP